MDRGCEFYTRSSLIGAWIIDIVDLYNVSSGCVFCTVRWIPIRSANCFECHRIFASKPRSDRIDEVKQRVYPCVVQRQHTIARALVEFSLLCLCRETRTSRIPLTLGNPCRYQLPEIPHTYSIKSKCCRLLHIWGGLAQFAVTDVCVFANSKHFCD